MNLESQKAAIGRVRSEVLRRKGISQTPPPPLPAPQKKSVMQKAASWLERAKEKHLRAQKWPKFFRPLRRNQESINEALIASMQGMMRELEYFSRLSGPMGAQITSLTARMDRETEETKVLEERVTQAESRLPITYSPEPLDAFYVAFEDKFRGSTELIHNRLAEFVPHLQSLRTRIPQAQGLDLGCGRGEWLGVLKGNGIPARGIDCNAKMVEICRNAGLEAEKADALDYLQGLPSSSLALVSGLHIVEHFEFSYLLALMTEVCRVLAPGGLAIFETPNPEGLKASACTFYLDPTHRNPIPMELLSFMASHVGFSSTEIVRLHPCGEEEKMQACGDYAGIFIK